MFGWKVPVHDLSILLASIVIVALLVMALLAPALVLHHLQN